MMTEADRYNTDRPDLCPYLVWKGKLVWAELDPTVPSSQDGLFWCSFTQTCLGPDDQLAEPGTCSSIDRPCYGTGQSR